MGGGSIVKTNKAAIRGPGHIGRIVTQESLNYKLTRYGGMDIETMVDTCSKAVVIDIAGISSPPTQVLLNYFLSGNYAAIYTAELAWRNRHQLAKTAEAIGEVWQKDSTPLSDKIAETTIIGGKTLVEIIKKEGPSFIKKEFPKIVANSAMHILDENEITDKVINGTPFEPFKEEVKELIANTVEDLAGKLIEDFVK